METPGFGPGTSVAKTDVLATYHHVPSFKDTHRSHLPAGLHPDRDQAQSVARYGGGMTIKIMITIMSLTSF